MKADNDKVVTVKADRDILGRLVNAAKSRDIDLREVLCYELSPVPFSIAHADGSLRKTTRVSY